MGDDSCGAVPRDLINYSLQCKKLDGEISRQARTLGEALFAFIASQPDARYISSVPRLDAQVTDHAARALPIDDWVGRVGEAFKQAGTSPDLQINHHLPPEDRINKADILLTASLSTLDQLIPTQEDALKGEAASQGAKDSAALLSAYNAGDAGRMRAEIAKLQAHMDDPDYLAGYFQSLGPDLIRGIPYYFMTLYHGDQGTLKTYDEALALATQSSIWSSDLNSQLFPPFDGSRLGTSGEVDAKRDFTSYCEMNEVLLRYGSFSTDFLQKATNEIVLTRIDDPNTLPPGVLYQREYTNQYKTVLNALSRSPDAALAVLEGHYTHALFNRTDPRSNVQVMLQFFGQDEREGGDKSLGNDLATVILAAGEQSTNVDHTHGQLLRDIGGIDDWRNVPDGARGAIAQLITDYTDDFKQGGNEQGDKLTWQQNLFVIAELNSNGKVDGQRLSQINDAINETALNGDDQQQQAELHNLATLGALPIFLSAAYRKALHEERVSLLLDGLGMIPLVGVIPNLIEAVRQFIKGDNVSGGLSALAALADVVGLAFAVRGVQAARAAGKGLTDLSRVEKGVDLEAVEAAIDQGKPLAEIDRGAAGAGKGADAGSKPLPEARPPNKRHNLTGVRTTTTKKKLNTVIAPWVDVNADVELIRAGKYTRQDNDLIVNGRTYRVEPSGTLIPVSGPGFYQLNRMAYLALGILNEEGGLTPAAEARLSRYRDLTDADLQAALEAWRTGQGTN